MEVGHVSSLIVTANPAETKAEVLARLMEDISQKRTLPDWVYSNWRTSSQTSVVDILMEIPPPLVLVSQVSWKDSPEARVCI